MTNEEILALVEKYGRYQQLGGFEHRFDPDSSAVMYALIRKYQPISCLSIGTWYGGSTCCIMKALKDNGKEFTYIASELLDTMRDSTETNCLQACQRAPIMIGDITQNLDKVPKKIDFLFHDTDHDEETTRFVYENIFPRLIKGALVIIHDFAVEEKEGKWIGKGAGGIGGLPETQFWMDKHAQGKLPLKKLYWTYHNPFYDGMNAGWEGSFWEKE